MMMTSEHKTDGNVSLKALYRCACGHERRIHLVIERQGREKEPVKWGKCLGGTNQQPMSCDCDQYGQ